MRDLLPRQRGVQALRSDRLAPHGPACSPDGLGQAEDAALGAQSPDIGILVEVGGEGSAGCGWGAIDP